MTGVGSFIIVGQFFVMRSWRRVESIGAGDGMPVSRELDGESSNAEPSGDNNSESCGEGGEDWSHDGIAARV